MGNKNIIAAFLAITAMVGFLIVFGVLGFMKVPPENKDFFNIGFIALINCVSIAFGYYLGSSLGSAQKNDLLSPIVPDKSASVARAAAERPDAGFIRLPLLFIGLLICGCFLVAGCATATAPKNDPQILAGKSLLAVKSTIVTAATATDSLCKAQKISQDNCMQAKAAYEQAKPAYDAAVDAYLLMSQGGDPDDFGRALTRVQSIADNMLQLTGGAR